MRFVQKRNARVYYECWLRHGSAFICHQDQLRWGRNMDISYGDIVETIRDERGIVIGFEDDMVIVRFDDGSRGYIQRRNIACVIHNQD